MILSTLIRAKQVNQEEAAYVVEAYIKARKGKDVNITIDMRYGTLGLIDQMQKLTRAHLIASCWFLGEGY